MPYVKRDEFGRIVSVYLFPSGEELESVAEGSSELMEFIIALSDAVTLREYFDRLDKDFIRVMEDVVHVLIEKRVLSLTDLPAAAQRKLSERRNLRGRKGDLSAIVARNEDLIQL